MGAFGRYEILERLGAGGMAEVFRARAYGADGFVKDLVVKKILPGHSRDDGFRKLFVDEAKITVGLTHSNIVQVFDFGRVDDTYFIAMEQVNGIDLRRLLGSIEEKTLTIPIAVSLFIVHEVLKGLDYAHRRADSQGRPLGIVHRDVSPANILLSWEGEVKVADFGIARTAERTELLNGQLVGKPRYMSPEQIRDEPLDGRSDVFSVGVVLHELLTGRQPFATRENEDTFHQILAGTPPKPTDTAPYLPRELDPIVQKALARNRAERWPSAAAMAEAIEEYALDHRLRLQPSTLSDFLRLAVAVPEAPKTPDPPTKEVTVLSLLDEEAEDGGVAAFTSAVAPTEKMRAVGRPPHRIGGDGATLHPASAPRQGRRWFFAGAAAAIVIAVALGRGFFLPAAAPVATPAAAAATSAATSTPLLADEGTVAPSREETPVVLATPRSSPERTATPKATAAPTAAAAVVPGTLIFNSDPVGDVLVNGAPTGRSTPIVNPPLELAPGTHEITVVNESLRVRASFTVRIESGKQTRAPGLKLEPMK